MKNLYVFLNTYKNHHPLRFLLIIAALLRILAGFFSKGYVFFDDHYCVIEQAQDWIYGFSHDLIKHDPPMHSVPYSGLHYYLFKILESFGIHDPNAKMTINRLIHGLYSLLTVYFSYKITSLISSRQNAFKVGLILSCLWFMPFLCTKDLVETVCTPLCLGGFYFLLKTEDTEKRNYKYWVFAGLLFGLAFIFRMHTILFAGGAGLILLYRKQWAGSFLFAISYLVAAGGIQGLIDSYFFEYPFHSLVAYYEYNSTHAYDYITAPFYTFFLVILGFLIPPVSVFLIIGYLRSGKKEPIIFTAGLIFFLFHSYFPNKQERFILPLLPLIIILGVVGWQDLYEKSALLQRKRKLINYGWIFFWVVNSIVCTLLIFTYSKKSKIEPLVYLSHKQPLHGIVLETANNTPDMPPVFYLGRFASTYDYYKERTAEIARSTQEGKINPDSCIMIYLLPKGKNTMNVVSEIKEMGKIPEYVVFSGSSELAQRIDSVKKIFPRLRFETDIAPAFYDEILHFLNPGVHKDQRITIYKTNEHAL